MSIMLFAACKNKTGNTNVDLSDSLGNRVTDTTRRNDTAYYERLQQKTGAQDTNAASRRRNDTASYERLPNKSNPKDSVR